MLRSEKIKGHEILFFDPLPVPNLAEKFFGALVGVLEQYGAKKVFVEKWHPDTILPLTRQILIFKNLSRNAGSVPKEH